MKSFRISIYMMCQTIWKVFTKSFHYHIVRTPNPDFLKEKVNFNYLPWREESENFKKRERKKKRGGGGGCYFSYVLFKGLSILRLQITLPFVKLCYAFKGKLFFSATIILWQKVILNCLKMILKISNKLRQPICKEI